MGMYRSGAAGMWSLDASYGCLGYSRYQGTYTPHGFGYGAMSLEDTSMQWDWIPSLDHRSPFVTLGIHLPLWIPFFLLAFPTARMFIVDYIAANRSPGLCPKCRYDLAGNSSGLCPECGHAILGN